MREQLTLLLTRPRDQSLAFADALETEAPGRFRIVVAPVLTVEPTTGPLDTEGAQGLLFTSANGVEQYADRTDDRRLPALCVGAMTAEAARRRGFAAQSADGDVAALACLAIARHQPGKGDFIHVRGSHAAGDLIGRLRAAGIPARAAELYDQRPCPLSPEARDLLRAGDIQVVALFSPRSAALLAAQLREADPPPRSLTSVALSAAADAGLDAPEPLRRIVARHPTRDGIIQALAGLGQAQGAGL